MERKVTGRSLATRYTFTTYFKQNKNNTKRNSASRKRLWSALFPLLPRLHDGAGRPRACFSRSGTSFAIITDCETATVSHITEDSGTRSTKSASANSPVRWTSTYRSRWNGLWRPGQTTMLTIKRRSAAMILCKKRLMQSWRVNNCVERNVISSCDLPTNRRNRLRWIKSISGHDRSGQLPSSFHFSVRSQSGHLGCYVVRIFLTGLTTPYVRDYLFLIGLDVSN